MLHKMKSGIVSLLFLSSQCLSSWDYDHVSEWADTYSMCAAVDQSPIDINHLRVIKDAGICGPEFKWNVDFTKQTFQIENDGNGVSLKAVEEIIDIDQDMDNVVVAEDGNDTTTYLRLSSNDNTIAKFPNYFQPFSFVNDIYCLDSIHFHWGTDDELGSEHTINGKSFPLEVQFNHYTCEHSTFAKTLEQYQTEQDVLDGVLNGDDTHQLGVVSILFDVVEDKTNPVFDKMFMDETLDHILFPEHSVKVIDALNLYELIPEDVQSAGYYAYEGSLTTPPCTNIVRWFVMNSRGYIGKSQMEKFRELRRSENRGIAPNHREIQQNTNKVYSCKYTKNTTGTKSSSVQLNLLWVFLTIIMIVAALIAICSIAKKFEDWTHDNPKPNKKPVLPDDDDNPTIDYQTQRTAIIDGKKFNGLKTAVNV